MSEILAIDSLKCMDLSEEMKIVKKFILNSQKIYIKLNTVNEKMRKENYEYFGYLLPTKIDFFLSSVSKENLYYQSAWYKDNYSDEIYGKRWRFTDNQVVHKGSVFRLYLKGNIDIFHEEIQKELQIINNRRVDIEKLENYYIEKDKKRFRSEEYSDVIYDINKGSWDIFDDLNENYELDFSGNSDEKELEEKYFNQIIYARNPKYDIVESGVIGIDFGTKSTVVVSYRDDNEGIEGSKTLPIRISGNSSVIEKTENYENATVMYFYNLERFLGDYEERDGRPDTSYDDIQVALEAENKLSGITSGEAINSFMTDLKQWASSKDKKKKIIDSNGNIYTIDGYLELEEDDFDPIEIYAYYIGCRINDMLYNSIFLDYYLSFPVTYELSVKNKILESFRKGIMKSLPNSILEDEEIMKQFRVSFGASEPASYAITALKKFCIEPSENNEIGYSVFDFGGGTTDFSYGIYREKENSRKYDYEIQELESGGDKYLGGENLLSLIAFDVFQQNREKLVTGGYNITLPLNKKKEVGYEVFVSEGSFAEYNMKSLMEKMRGYWEERLTDEEKEVQNITVNLVNKNDESKGVELSVDYERLDLILYNRINEGVISFTEKFKTIFKEKKLKEIYIFLAGNSSKSSFVKELFNQEFNEEMRKSFNIIIKDARAIEKLNSNDKDSDDSSEENPQEQNVIGLNSKTGVAFGLVELREGNGEVEYIPFKNAKKSEEINFKYCIGYSKKKRFIPIIKFDTEYNRWIKYDEVEEDEGTIEVLYSDNTRAEGNEFPASECLRVKVVNTENENGYLYIRLKNPNTIQYVIAKDENSISEEKIKEKILN